MVGVQLEMLEKDKEVLVVVVEELLKPLANVVSSMLYLLGLRERPLMLLLRVSLWFAIDLLSYYLTVNRLSSMYPYILLLISTLHVKLLLCLFMFLNP